MTIDAQVALWAIGTLLVIGGFYADTRRRLAWLERCMNGDSPFLRKNEANIMREGVEMECERLSNRIESVAKRTHRHSTTITTHSLSLSELERRIKDLEERRT